MISEVLNSATTAAVAAATGATPVAAGSAAATEAGTPAAAAATDDGKGIGSKIEEGAQGIWDWFKGIGDTDLGGLLGGGVGVLGAWIISGMFGGGTLGTIAFLLLAVGGFLMGKNSLGDTMNDLMGRPHADGSKRADNSSVPAPQTQLDASSPAAKPGLSNEEMLSMYNYTPNSGITFTPNTGAPDAPAYTPPVPPAAGAGVTFTPNAK